MSSDEDVVAKSFTTLVLLGGRSGNLLGSTVGSPGINPKMLHQAHKHMILSSLMLTTSERHALRSSGMGRHLQSVRLSQQVWCQQRLRLQSLGRSRNQH